MNRRYSNAEQKERIRQRVRVQIDEEIKKHISSSNFKRLKMDTRLSLMTMRSQKKNVW